MIPDIQVVSYRNRELLVLQVHHMAGPFYLKSLGLDRGTYIRLGSTNRIADKEIILSLQMLAKNITFDELPCLDSNIDDLDTALIQQALKPVFGELTKKQYVSLGLGSYQNKKVHPSNGGILLFSQKRFKYFHDSSIDCVCFADHTHEEIIDRKEIRAPLINAHDEIIGFVKRNTKLSAVIHEAKREDVPQYPSAAIREVVINAIVHADYSMKGARIQLAIFSDRIEVTSPGGLPYGQTMDQALSGISRMRNRVMGRIFRELKLIERLGTGIKRIISIYKRLGVKQPIFEEFNTHFRVTLFSTDLIKPDYHSYEKILISHLNKVSELSVPEIANLWGVSVRTVRRRLKSMLEVGLIQRIASSPKDPYAVYRLHKKHFYGDGSGSGDGSAGGYGDGKGGGSGDGSGFC